MSEYASVYSVLNTSGKQEDLRRQLTEKLRGMSALPNGWSYGEGVCISKEAINEAAFFVYVATDLGFKSEVFPNLDGGCAVAAYEGDETLEISVRPDRRLCLRIEKGFGMDFEDVVPPTEDVSVDEAVTRLVEFRNDIWSFASSIYETSTQTGEDLETLFIEIHPSLLLPSHQTDAEAVL
jgi:hypothetical protein